MLKRIILYIVFLSVGLGVLFWIIKFLNWVEAKTVFYMFFSWQGAVLFGLIIMVKLSGIWKWQFILKTQGYNFPFGKIGKIWLASSTIDYLTPVALFGGDFFRIYTLKKFFPSISWEKSIASDLIDKICDLTIIFFIVVIGLIYFTFFNPFLPSKIIFVFLGIIVLFTAIFVFFYFKSHKKESILDLFFKIFGIKKEKLLKNGNGKVFLGAEDEVLYFFDTKKAFFWKGIGLTVFKYLLVLVLIIFLLYFLTGSFNVLKASAIFSFVDLAYLTPVPMGLGSLEAFQSFAFHSFGLGAEIGISFSLIFRGLEILVNLVGIIFLVTLGIRLATMRLTDLVEKISKQD